MSDLNDCFLHDKDRLRHDDALAILRQNVPVLTGREPLPIDQCLGRVLGQDLVSQAQVPGHTNAAVDGYAFRHADNSGASLPVRMHITAGERPKAALASGEAARIFTGAVMPDGADTVAMQEDCDAEGNAVRIPQKLRQGANVRQAGEDVSIGTRVLAKGQRLDASALAAAVSVGCAMLEVAKPVRVGLISTGDELRHPGDGHGPLQMGQVWDSNTPMLRALLAPLPVTIAVEASLPDDREGIQAALADAAGRCDIILSTGGASRGVEDHMLDCLDALGKRHLWQLAVKPGRPMMMGQIDRDKATSCLFLGLPGNPVAAMVCFLLYARQCILQAAGEAWSEPQRFPLQAGFEVASKKPDRREFMRGKLIAQPDGQLSVEKFARDGSGLISSLTWADGLIEIPEDVRAIELGDTVSFIPFTSFG